MTTPLDSWLALTEEDPIEPDMPILDPHHHFWERPGDVYLLEHLLTDTRSGHRVAQTVFVECRSQYRTTGPEELRSVGEVEFVASIAAASAAAGSETAVAAAIVGNADLMLGDRAAPVLEALSEAGQGRFRGIRRTAAWDASPEITTARANSAGMLGNSRVSQRAWPAWSGWAFPSTASFTTRNCRKWLTWRGPSPASPSS